MATTSVASGPQVEITADLRFSVELPGHHPVTGTAIGSGNRLEVRLSDPAYFAGGRDADRLRGVAAALASQGVTVVVIADEVVLLEIGATHAPWWQRRLTRSRNVRVVSLRGAFTGALGRLRRASAEAVLPGSELLPPATLFPIAPTFGPSDRSVTTTHDPRRGGNPRLVLTTGNARLPEGRKLVFGLAADVTTIGSDPTCDICLTGLEPLHAVVLHDDRDEFVLQDRSSSHGTLINGAVVTSGRVLRTGARVTVGSWSLAFRRAEFADHGRPFGGRVGGEVGRQRRQPDLRGSAEPTSGPTVVLDPAGLR